MVGLDIGMIGGAQVFGEVAHRFGYNLMFLVIAGITLTSASIYAFTSIPVWKARRRESA